MTQTQDRPVHITGLAPNLQKLLAIKQIRKLGDMSLPDAKALLTATESGEEATFQLAATESPIQEIQRLANLGVMLQWGEESFKPAEGQPGSTFWDQASAILIVRQILMDREHNRVTIVTKLKRGEFSAGDRLCLPIHDRLTIGSKIDEWKIWEGNHIIWLEPETSTPEHGTQYEFWNEMVQPGDELPIFKGK